MADLVERGLQPDIAQLFIVDGARALSRTVRDTFGSFALIQRCRVRKGRNIVERLDPSLRGQEGAAAGLGKPDRQAKRVLRNLARRLIRFLHPFLVLV
jgi:hypothetical protein